MRRCRFIKAAPILALAFWSLISFYSLNCSCDLASHARRDNMVWHTYALPRSQVRKPLTLDPARSRQRSPLWWPRSGITGRLPISSRQDQRLLAFKSSLLARERVRELQ